MVLHTNFPFPSSLLPCMNYSICVLWPDLPQANPNTQADTQKQSQPRGSLTRSFTPTTTHVERGTAMIGISCPSSSLLCDVTLRRRGRFAGVHPPFSPVFPQSPRALRGKPVRGLRLGNEEKQATPARQRTEGTSPHVIPPYYRAQRLSLTETPSIAPEADTHTKRHRKVSFCLDHGLVKM
jgi:hypothetical protein